MMLTAATRRLVSPHRALLVALCCVVAACRKDDTDTARPERRGDGGPPVVAEATVDKARVEIGDKFAYTLRVKYEPEYEVVFPAVLEPFANWLIHDPGQWEDRADSGTKKVREITVRLDPGIEPILTIPALEIRFRKTGREGWDIARTEEITVEVASVADEPGEFHEPLDHFALPVKAKASRRIDNTKVVLIGLAGLVAIAVIAWALLRTRRRPPAPVIPPDEVARREFERLAEMRLMESGRVKEFYYRLTDIVRRYIEGRFGIMAPERTTEEFLVLMRRHPALEEAHKRRLEDFLTIADLVKYAKFTPAPDEAGKALDSARAFVTATAPASGQPRRFEEAGHAV